MSYYLVHIPEHSVRGCKTAWDDMGNRVYYTDALEKKSPKTKQLVGEFYLKTGVNIAQAEVSRVRTIEINGLPNNPLMWPIWRKEIEENRSAAGLVPEFQP